MRHFTFLCSLPLLSCALLVSNPAQASAALDAPARHSSVAEHSSVSGTPDGISSTNYLAGAVPEVNGQVQFSHTFTAPSKTRAELFAALQHYLNDSVMKRSVVLPASRVTAAEVSEGLLSAAMSETLWFKRTAWVSDFATVHYQLTFEVGDGRVVATVRNIRYRYEAYSDTGNDDLLKAENWITDKEALTRNGKKLTRVGGKKFRVKTIDLQKQLFDGATAACR